MNVRRLALLSLLALGCRDDGRGPSAPHQGDADASTDEGAGGTTPPPRAPHEAGPAPAPRVDAGSRDEGAPPPSSRSDAGLPPDDGGGPRDAGGDRLRSADASGDRAGAPTSPAGCPTGRYPVCLDFEAKTLDRWTSPSPPMVVETGHAAHGQGALHIDQLTKRVLLVNTMQLGAIKDVMWGRFYLFMKPGAPYGHGYLLGARDQSDALWEVGFEYNNFFGMWTGKTPEKYMRSKDKIPGDRWVCVEFLFDGAKPEGPRIWHDGAEVTYTTIANRPGPLPAVQFRKVELGWRPAHGTSLVEYETDAPPNLTDLWIDDLALDTKRVGCIE